MQKNKMISQSFPLVTIGITSYNSSATILDAIQSAVVQDWPSLEIIIIDDCSTDGTQKKIREFVKKFTNIKFICLSENQGVAHARNEIIGCARGDFIAFFDDDDVSEPNRISIQYDHIIKHENESALKLVVSQAARLQIYPNNFSRIEAPPGYGGGVFGKKIVERILYGKVALGVVGSAATCSQMARLSVYKELRGFDESLQRSEDTDFIVRLALAGGGIIGIQEPLVIQRMTPGSEKTLLREYIAMRTILNKYKNFLIEQGWYDFILNWHEAKFALAQKRYKDLISILVPLLIKYPKKLLLKLVWSWPSRESRAARNSFIERIS